MKRFIKSIYAISALLIAAVCGMSLASCAENDPLGAPSKDYNKLSDRFDFKTSEYIPIRIEAPAGCYVALYERDPRKYKKAMPFFSTFVNDDGRFSEDVDVPQHLINQEIYVSANGNIFTAKLDKKGTITYTGAASRGSVPGIKVNYEENSRIKEYFDKIMIKNHNNEKLVDTSRAGVDLETLEDSTQVVFSLVNVTGRYMMQIYYYYYPAERTAPGQSNFQDEKKMAEFIKRFLRPEFCISKNWQNTYTGYKHLSDHSLTDSSKCGAIYDPTGASTSGWINRNYESLLNQEKTTVTLNYYGWFNSQGEFTDIDNPVQAFPKDYKIGFFMYVAVPEKDEWISNSSSTDYNEHYYDDPKKVKKHYVISTDRIINYEITPHRENGEIVEEPYVHYDRMCATRLLSYYTDGTVCIVYGMEDNLTGKGDDAKDFNDLFFTVQTNPLVDVTDIPLIGQGFYAYEGTLLYEDLYPIAGDYDMNDVIVEYRYVMWYDHIKDEGNKVSAIYYEFTPIWDGATYTSDFYLNIKQGGSIPDQQIKICSDINATAAANAQKIKQNVAMGRDIDEGLTKFTGKIDEHSGLNLKNILGKYVRDLDVRYTLLDPFIHVTNTNYEVHTPGNVAVLPGTLKCDDPEQLLKYYHVSSEDVYYAMGLETPFAVNIALRSFGTELGFKECAETHPISECYSPFYADWVSSKGASSKNWYMRYNYVGPK